VQGVPRPYIVLPTFTSSWIQKHVPESDITAADHVVSVAVRLTTLGLVEGPSV
jgi:hypothetical protein